MGLTKVEKKDRNKKIKILESIIVNTRRVIRVKKELYLSTFLPIKIKHPAKVKAIIEYLKKINRVNDDGVVIPYITEVEYKTKFKFSKNNTTVHLQNSETVEEYREEEVQCVETASISIAKDDEHFNFRDVETGSCDDKAERPHTMGEIPPESNERLYNDDINHEEMLETFSEHNCKEHDESDFEDLFTLVVSEESVSKINAVADGEDVLFPESIFLADNTTVNMSRAPATEPDEPETNHFMVNVEEIEDVNIPKDVNEILEFFKKCKISNGFNYDQIESHLADWYEFLKTYEKDARVFLRPYKENGFVPKELVVNIPTIYASKEMMRDFNRFIAFMNYIGANESGACLVVPYKGFDPHKGDGRWLDKLPKQMAYKQIETNGKKSGQSKLVNVLEKEPSGKFQLHSFFNYSTKLRNGSVKTSGRQAIEEMKSSMFNKQTTTSKYIKDLPGTLFADESEFNLNRLDTLLSKHGNWDTQNNDDGAGLINSYLYIGSPKNTGGDHIEDFGSCSGIYHHGGMSKYWRLIPPSFFTKYLGAMKLAAKDIFNNTVCNNYVLHKSLIAKDSFLKENNIVYNEIMQPPETFFFTFESAVHMIINEGFNITESVNFNSNPEWPLIAATSFGCKHFDDEDVCCEFGNMIQRTPDSWIRTLEDKELYNDWKHNRLVMKHYYEVERGSEFVFGETLETEVPDYYCNPKDESLDNAFKLRKIR